MSLEEVEYWLDLFLRFKFSDIKYTAFADLDYSQGFLNPRIIIDTSVRRFIYYTDINTIIYFTDRDGYVKIESDEIDQFIRKTKIERICQ